MGDELQAEVIAAWTRGDANADRRIVQHFYAGVRRFFDLRCTAAADDLTQQTFLALLEARGRYEGRAKFKTFVFGIAHKQLLRHLRARVEGPRARRFGTEPDEKTSLSMVAVRKQEHQLVLMALTQLPVELQIAVELYYWEDMQLGEIASVLEVNPSTLGSRLARARELLRENLQAMTRPGALRDRLLGDLEGWSRALGPVTADANRVAREP
ncbi:MAG: sigma-70 family RNA polymerase sigma factor [Myxococcota bacterium]